MNETRDLTAFCCPAPTEESTKNMEACKEFSEGIDQKEGREKWKAYNCLNECAFKTNGLLIDGELADKTKIKEAFETYLKSANDLDYVDVTSRAVDYCMDKSEFYEFSLFFHAKYEIC